MKGRTLPVGALILFLLAYTNAAPSLTPRPFSILDKRFSTLIGCDEKQTTKAGQALADMANLALHAFDTASTQSLGYSHYFRDADITVFKSAMSTIQQNNDPTNAPYNFIVNCSPTGDVLNRCGKDSYAITDATVPKDASDEKSIWLCPLFFTGDDSKNDLPSTEDEDKDKLDEWCNQDSYKKFTTAGHVLLHEITHLDAVAKEFPLDPNDDKQHGTEDYIKGSSPIEWARRLKEAVDNQPGREDIPAAPYNAESYAGAATELWAMKFCKKDFIPPKTGH